jgi:putative ABC transport system permease protein
MKDLLQLALGALLGHRLRSLLSMLGIAVGVASVILLTSIGEGTRVYIVSQFQQFGTTILAITPGKQKTVGLPGVLGGTTHKLSLDDAVAISRLPVVVASMPIAFGQARVEARSRGRGRSVLIYGVTPDLPKVWNYQIQQGTFWPSRDPFRAAPYAVLGPKLARELFDQQGVLGEFVHIDGRRFRVLGVMEPKGALLGIDLGDTIYIPVASAMQIFNVDEVTEIDVNYVPHLSSQQVEDVVRPMLMARHADTEDFTLIAQDAMLDVMGNVMGVVTAAVGAIAGVSLLVGAVGILTMMWIAVGERKAEIGLLRAIGASRRQVAGVFLAESAALALLGGLLGVAAGLALQAILRLLVPGLPLQVPYFYVFIALATSLATGLLSGVVPAHRAGSLDPIEALRAE